MSDARKRAEEALAAYDRCKGYEADEYAMACIEPFRALLAERRPGRDRISELESLLRECNAVCLCGCPDGDHEADECGESCGNEDHECVRVAPAVLEIVQRYRVALSNALTPAPAPDAVAEDEIETARAMLGLTVRMAEAKHACRDTACRNVLTAALNMLLAIDAALRGEVKHG